MPMATNIHTLAVALLESNMKTPRANWYINHSFRARNYHLVQGKQDIITVARETVDRKPLSSTKFFKFTVAFIAGDEERGHWQEFSSMDEVAAYVYDRWNIMATVKMWEPIDITLGQPFAQTRAGGFCVLLNWPNRPWSPTTLG